MVSTAQNCCDQDSVITICYLSAMDHCGNNIKGCYEYSFDGDFMKNALKLKLENPDNFGLDGIANCILKLEELPKRLKKADLEDKSCDIVFLPSVTENEITQILTATFISNEILEEVYAWSTECVNNLVIASQGETTFWGYEIRGNNQNPNVQAPQRPETAIKIFNGPFGDVSSFEQGGGFEAIFVNPQPAHEVLAVDNAGRPTILVDEATNDLMVGDIGIFCSGSAGEISDSSLINNDNDIFALNIFALACDLAESPNFINETFEACQPILLPDGSTATEPGIYTHTEAVQGRCENIFRTEIIPCENVMVPNIFSPNQDGINDFFNLITDSDILIEDMKVFNRWGELIYNNDNPDLGWDGTLNGSPTPPGVYIYQIIYTNSIGSRREIKTGDFTLLR